MQKNKLIFSTLALGLATGIVSQALATDVKLDAQVRYRSEFTNGSFDSDVDAFGVSYLRTRLGFTAMPTDGLTMYIQAQDSRITGMPVAGALEDPEGMDVHQAYFSWDCRVIPGLNLTAGRFEMPKADHRFFGNVGWSNTGRSFEGWVAGYTLPFTMVQFYGLKVVENMAANMDRTAWGLYFNNLFGKRIDVFYNNDDFGEDAAEKANVRSTLGVHYDNKGEEYMDGALGVNFNFAMQMGTNEQGAADVDYAGMLIDFDGSYKLGDGIVKKIGFGYETQSGSTDATEMGWQNLYHTGHKFNGYMDFFLNGGPNGLNDIELNVWGNVADFIDYKLDFHMFSSVEEFNGASGMDTAIGNEIDLTLSKKFDNFTVNAGYSMFMADDHFAGDPNDGMNWMYLQFIAGFKN